MLTAPTSPPHLLDRARRDILPRLLSASTAEDVTDLLRSIAPELYAVSLQLAARHAPEMSFELLAEIALHALDATQALLENEALTRPEEGKASRLSHLLQVAVERLDRQSDMAAVNVLATFADAGALRRVPGAWETLYRTTARALRQGRTFRSHLLDVLLSETSANPPTTAELHHLYRCLPRRRPTPHALSSIAGHASADRTLWEDMLGTYGPTSARFMVSRAEALRVPSVRAALEADTEHPPALPALVRTAEPSELPALFNQLMRRDLRHAAWALDQMEARLKAALSAADLAPLLSSPDRHVRLAALRALPTRPPAA